MQVISAIKHMISGPAGPLELSIAEQPTASSTVAVVCHPHPLYGGNMDNKVVTTTVKTLYGLGFTCACFNFRGVGKSAGNYAYGEGEQADLLAVISWLKQQYQYQDLILAGFSFGSYIASCIAQAITVKALIAIAPPVQKFSFPQALAITNPVIVIHGEQDELIALSQVRNWLSSDPNARLITIPNASHFFHGQLTALQNAIITGLSTELIT